MSLSIDVIAAAAERTAAGNAVAQRRLAAYVMAVAPLVQRLRVLSVEEPDDKVTTLEEGVAHSRRAAEREVQRDLTIAELLATELGARGGS